MSKFKAPVSDVTDIALLRSEVTDILKNLSSIEYNEVLDSRSFSSMDVIEAINITRSIIKTRLTYGSLVEWRKDDQNEYLNLFNSIAEEIKLAITFLFSTDDRKRTARFVHTFNNLIVERIVQMCKVIGPTGTVSLIDPLIDQFIIEFQKHDEFTSIDAAQQSLQQYRREVMRKHPVFKTRLELIQHLFEQVQAA